jgi:hypothetical protein
MATLEKKALGGAIKGLLNFGKGIGKQIAKSRPGKAVGDYVKKTTEAGAKKAAKETTKKTKVTPKTKVKTKVTPKSKYGTKGSHAGWAKFNRTQSKKGFKGKKISKKQFTSRGSAKPKTTAKPKGSVFDKNINPFSGKFSAKDFGKGLYQKPIALGKWALNNKAEAIAYTVAGNWAGKKLGLWGGPKPATQTNKPEYKNYMDKPKKRTYQSFERTGGPVRAYGGRVTPGMKTGGGLKWRDGKWVR